MTVAIPNQTAYSYNGNGVTTEFSFPLRFLEDEDLQVVVADANGVETVMELDVDYTVTGAGDPSGGSAVFIDPPDVGTNNVTIRRLTLPTQTVDLEDGSRVPGDTLEEQLDRIVMVAQDLKRQLAEIELTPGPAGVSAFLFGTGVPASGLGDDGNLYWDTDTGDIYSKASGSWTLEDTVTGPQGQNAVWRQGSGAPSAGLGNDGDMYINTANGATYNKVGGAWVAGANLTGPAGAGTGDMLKSANLSDVASAATAFSNIKQAATTSATGVSELADNTETAALADTARTVTPAGLGAMTQSDTQRAMARRATQAEAQAGSNNVGQMTPLRTAEAIAAQVPSLVGWEHIDGGGTNGAFEGSSVATVDFEALGLSAFRHLWLVGWLRPATDNTRLYLRTDANDGASFDAGGSDYYWTAGYNVPSGAHGTDQALGAAQVELTDAVGNDTDDGLLLDLKMVEFNQARNMHGHALLTVWHQGGYMLEKHVAFSRRSTTARNAFRLLMNSGNIAAYNLHLFGIRG